MKPFQIRKDINYMGMDFYLFPLVDESGCILKHK